MEIKNKSTTRIVSHRTGQKEHFAFSNHNITKVSAVLDNLEQHVALDLVEPLLVHSEHTSVSFGFCQCFDDGIFTSV